VSTVLEKVHLSDGVASELDAGKLGQATISFLVARHRASGRTHGKATRCKSHDGHDLVVHTRGTGEIEIMLGAELDELERKGRAS